MGCNKALEKAWEIVDGSYVELEAGLLGGFEINIRVVIKNSMTTIE